MNKRCFVFLSGLLAFVLYIVSMNLSYEYELSLRDIIIRMIVITISCVFFVICNLMFQGEQGITNLIGLDVAVLLYHIIYVAATAKLMIGIRYWSQIYNEILWIVVTVFVLYHFLIRQKAYKSIKGFLRENSFYIIIAGIFSLVLIILSYDIDGPHFVCDSNTFYDAANRVQGTAIFSIRNAFACSHMDFSYFYPIIVYKYLLRSTSWAFFVNHAVLLTLASFGTVFLIKTTLYDQSRCVQVIASALCLSSPFVCGISTYYSPDFGVCCLAPLVLVLAIKRNWGLLFFSGFFFSHMKETSIILFAAICLSIILWELMKDISDWKRTLLHERTLSWVAIACIFQYHYERYAMWNGVHARWSTIIPMIGAFLGLASVILVYMNCGKKYPIVKKVIPIMAVLFVAGVLLYAYYNRVENSKKDYYSFRLNWEHIIQQTKCNFVLNFSWLYILIVCFIILICIIKRKRLPHYLIFYFVPATMSYLFSLAFVVEELPRYLNAFPILILLSVVTLIARDDIIRREHWKILALSVILVISATSSFYSYDPISRVVFFTTNVGSREIYSTHSGFDGGGDRCIYNRQYYGQDVVLDKIFERAVDCKDTITVSTGQANTIWGIDGRYPYESSVPERVFDEFWNIRNSTREPGYLYDYRSDPSLQLIQLRYIYPTENAVDVLSTERTGHFVYVYMPTQNEGRENEVRNSFAVVEEGSFESHGYRMAYIRGIK